MDSELGQQTRRRSDGRLITRNIVVGRGRTSMRLEPELWDAVDDICRRERIGIAELVQRAEERAGTGGRTSAVRAYLVDYFRHRSLGRDGPIESK